MTGRTLLAALLIGAAPALADDSSIHATYTSTAPLSSSPRGVEGERICGRTIVRVANGTSQLSPQGLQASLREREANPRQARWGVAAQAAELDANRTLTPNPSPKGRGEEIVINPSADLGRHTVSHGSYLAGSNLYPVGRGKGATLKPDATSEQGVMTGAAVGLEDVDLSEIPLDKPLLDYLHENNVQIPQTEYDDEGNLVQSGSILAPESAYTLTEVPAGADGAAPAGDNIITKFEYNATDGSFTPKYYQLNLKQTTYGDTNGDTPITVQVNGPTDSVNITFKYNTPTIPESDYSNVYKDQTINLELEMPDEGDYQVDGGLADVTNVENVLFKNNKTDATLNVEVSGHTFVDILGGALNNSSTIDTLSGAFVDNSITGTVNSSGYYRYGYLYKYGAGLYNSGNITNINADFINNTNNTDYHSYGGAIANTGVIDNIYGNFISNSAYEGSAIYNKAGTIGNITSNFIDNNGIVIYNTYDGIIDNISSNFINNSSVSIYNEDGIIRTISSNFLGNASSGIGNQSLIEQISGNFIGNYDSDGGNEDWDFYSYGGAIYNVDDGVINSISGSFIGNYAETYGDYDDESTAEGGAIYNYERTTIGTITGDFIANYAKGARRAYGGAIYNDDDAIINNITGDFISNYASAPHEAYGGAIYNDYDAVIDNIKGDFIGNYIIESNDARGGAIYNEATINNITGTFINNHIMADDSKAIGGAIVSNDANIGIINADFIENYVNAVGGAAGGAVYLYQSEAPDSSILDYDELPNIQKISGNFSNNYVKSSNSKANGGALYADSFLVKEINGDFVNNYAYAVEDKANGGAVYLTDNAFIDHVSGTFHGNYAKSDAKQASGGAIYSSMGDDYKDGGLLNIEASFVNNYAESLNNNALGGAIYNDAKMDNITGDFTGNYAKATTGKAQGGALYLDKLSTLNSVTSDFVGNYTIAKENNSQGGAIYNRSEQNEIELNGNFEKNYSDGNKAYGGAVYNEGNISEMAGSFIENYLLGTATAYGGALYNKKDINTDLSGDFIGNYAVSDSGDAKGGAIHNTSYIKSISGDFINNYTKAAKSASAGAIYNSGTIDLISNSSFINNTVTSTGGSALGGAIYTNKDLTFEAKDNYTSVFQGNTTTAPKTDETTGVTTTVTNNNAIHVASKDATLNFNMSNGGKFYLADSITGSSEDVQNDDGTTTTDAYNVNITGDGIPSSSADEQIPSEETPSDETGATDDTPSTQADDTQEPPALDDTIVQEPENAGNTVFYMLNDIKNADFTIGNTTLNTINDIAHVYNFNSFALTGDTNFVTDVDLAAKEMDRFTAGSYGEHQGNLNVVGMNLLSDANMDEDVTAIYFAEPGLKNNVVNGTGELPDSYQTAYTPIYKYNVTYDAENEYDGKGDGGYFLFTRGDKIIYPDGGGGSTGNDSDAFNPAVLATPVGNLAAGQAAVNEAFKYVFEHADAFTQLPAMERYAKINANKYALSTDFNDNMPEYFDQLHNNAVWFRPYTTFESMNLDNGPDVDAITYGSLVGFDGDFKEMKNGWHRVFTGYAGYMGSSLNYSGVDTSMNGGLLGFTETFYKGNFWTAITASAGASVGESHTMYGKEDYTSLLAGVGSKTGYNFEFKDGKFIIQPIMYLSYTFVNTFDYKNAAGVNIESDPLHTIQLNPSVRFIANLKGGWQPYASVGMVWNLMNESKVTANNVKLPEMSVKPYVEYGVGVQRNWADKFTAFLQAMIRNGGRNGIALTGGFRFMLGSDDDNNDKPKVKKEIKSL